MCEGHPTRETLLLNIGSLGEIVSQLMGRVDELQKRIEELESILPTGHYKRVDPWDVKIVPL